MTERRHNDHLTATLPGEFIRLHREKRSPNHNYQRSQTVKTTIKLLIVLALALLPVTAASAKGPVTRHVSAGARDPFASFALTAKIFADGTMTGQYTDQFPQIGGGFHAVLNCVSIVGNDAWVSGVIISGSANGQDLTGLPVATRVRDNGTSANDPPDDVSFSFIGDPTPCTDHVDYELFTSPQGQVVIK
jgi:hypothetical protein